MRLLPPPSPRPRRAVAASEPIPSADDAAIATVGLGVRGSRRNARANDDFREECVSYWEKSMARGLLVGRSCVRTLDCLP